MGKIVRLNEKKSKDGKGTRVLLVGNVVGLFSGALAVCVRFVWFCGKRKSFSRGAIDDGEWCHVE